MEKFNDDHDSPLEASSRDWRVANLRSAYKGILSDEAFEYELGRFEGLQEVKRRKLATAKEKFEYEYNSQCAIRILIFWMIYCQMFFRVWHVAKFILIWILWKDPSSVPPLAWPFQRWDGWWMRRIMVVPAIVSLLAVGYFLVKLLWKRIWTEYRQLSLMILGGCVVVFMSLVFG